MERIIDTKKHICYDCWNNGDFPECLPDIKNVEYGNGIGNDNILKCTNFDNKKDNNELV